MGTIEWELLLLSSGLICRVTEQSAVGTFSEAIHHLDDEYTWRSCFIIYSLISSLIDMKHDNVFVSNATDPYY